MFRFRLFGLGERRCEGRTVEIERRKRPVNDEIEHQLGRIDDALEITVRGVVEELKKK